MRCLYTASARSCASHLHLPSASGWSRHGPRLKAVRLAVARKAWPGAPPAPAPSAPAHPPAPWHHPPHPPAPCVRSGMTSTGCAHASVAACPPPVGGSPPPLPPPPLPACVTVRDSAEARPDTRSAPAAACTAAVRAPSRARAPQAPLCCACGVCVGCGGGGWGAPQGPGRSAMLTCGEGVIVGGGGNSGGGKVCPMQHGAGRLQGRARTCT